MRGRRPDFPPAYLLAGLHPNVFGPTNFPPPSARCRPPSDGRAGASCTGPPCAPPWGLPGLLRRGCSGRCVRERSPLHVDRHPGGGGAAAVQGTPCGLPPITRKPCCCASSSACMRRLRRLFRPGTGTILIMLFTWVCGWTWSPPAAPTRTCPATWLP